MKVDNLGVQAMSPNEIRQTNGGGGPSVLWFNLRHAIRNAARVVGFFTGLSDGFSEGYSEHDYK